MTLKIGPTFIAELVAAGVTPSLSYIADTGALFPGPDMSPADIATAEAVLAAHDPARLPPASVDAIRDARLAAGFADPVLGKSFQLDTASMGKITAVGASAGLALALSIDPAPQYQFIAADNAVVTMSPAQAYAWSQRVAAFVSATYLYARTLKDRLADKPDITAGWP
jgi:hypothetical protein